MKIGLWGARADNTGLGTQTWEFYNHMKPDKTVGILMAKATGGKDNPVFLDRYGEEAIFTPVLDEDLMDTFLDGLDIVYCAETPYKYDLFRKAKEKGVKTVLQYNYEFLEYFDATFQLPDVLLAPSKWHVKDVQAHFGDKVRIEHLPFPVNIDRFKFREIEKIKTFVHIAGPKTFEDRNGTETLIEAISLLDAVPDIIIYTQEERDLGYLPEHVEVRNMNVDHYWDLCAEGDALILPRRYGGLSLQLNEAMASGMLPMMPNIGPQNHFLHPMMLTPTSGKKSIRTKTVIDAYYVEPKDLVEHMRLFMELEPEQVRELNNACGVYAMLISWYNMEQKYRDLFESVIKQK